MLPLCVPAELRHILRAVRLLGLKPPGVSTSEVLRAVIAKVVQGATRGFDGYDARSNLVTVFLGIVEFIGDYPAISHALDVLGHNACSPCHLCSFTRDSGAFRSRYGYRCDFNARASAHTRFKDRVAGLRAAGVCADDLRSIRVRPSEPRQLYLPLHELSEALEGARSAVPLTDHGHPVVPALFDSYQRCLVAPDHLVAGVAAEVIGAALAVSNARQGRHAEVSILEVLQPSRLISQMRLFDCIRGTLLNMAFSELFSLLLIAPNTLKRAWALSNASCQEMRRAVGPARIYPGNAVAWRCDGGTTARTAVTPKFLFSLQELFAETNYCPSAALEGIGAIEKFNTEGGARRLDFIPSLACAYVADLDDAVRIFSDPL
jgi:hypothetical protein